MKERQRYKVADVIWWTLDCGYEQKGVILEVIDANDRYDYVLQLEEEDFSRVTDDGDFELFTNQVRK